MRTSPRPIEMRQPISVAEPIMAASGVRKVKADQAITPAAKTALPPYLSASVPPASCVPAYPRKNTLRMVPW